MRVPTALPPGRSTGTRASYPHFRVARILLRLCAAAHVERRICANSAAWSVDLCAHDAQASPFGQRRHGRWRRAKFGDFLRRLVGSPTLRSCATRQAQDETGPRQGLSPAWSMIIMTYWRNTCVRIPTVVPMPRSYRLGVISERTSVCLPGDEEWATTSIPASCPPLGSPLRCATLHALTPKRAFRGGSLPTQRRVHHGASSPRWPCVLHRRRNSRSPPSRPLRSGSIQSFARRGEEERIFHATRPTIAYAPWRVSPCDSKGSRHMFARRWGVQTRDRRT